MSLDNVNENAFAIFLQDKNKKILKSINIDNKLMGIDIIDNTSDDVKIKAIYLWNNMTEHKQQKYIDQVKDKLDVSYDYTSL